MMDAQELLQQKFGPPFQGVAKLIERWTLEPEGYRWDEPLVVEVWQKLDGSFYALPTREEMRQFIGIAKTGDDALYRFLDNVRLEPDRWKKKVKGRRNG